MFRLCFLAVIFFRASMCLSGTDLPTAKLTVTVKDENGVATQARVKISTNRQSIKVAPLETQAVMYGQWDHADGYLFQPDSSFYIEGFFSLELPTGIYEIFISKGLEYIDERITINIADSKNLAREIKLKRWINMNSKKWFSGDDHIHIRRSPREDSILLNWIRAENLNVGVLLRMGDFWSTYYEQYAWGKNGVFQRENSMLTSGQEDPRTPEVGHTLSLAADDKVRFSNEYYLYDKVFDRIHSLNGITGYAHQAESFHGYRGLILDGVRNKVDALELIQFCVSDDPLLFNHYYHMLNLGFKLTAIGGSDFPWCGRDHSKGRPDHHARIGDVRFYSYVAGEFNFENWRNALRKGNTFATSGPILMFEVNHSKPGETVNVKTSQKLNVSIKAYGNHEQVPLSRIELVKYGQVIASKNINNPADRDSISFTVDLSADEGCWLAARCFAGAGQAAHTTPIYISVNGSGFADKVSLQENIKKAETYLKELEDEIQIVKNDPEKQSWRYRKGIEIRINEARAVLRSMREKAVEK
jgi:hypothetical protein